MKKAGFWMLLFAVLFLFSQGTWMWSDEVELGAFGFPKWMYGVVLWQIILVGAIYWFSKKYWQ